MRSDSALGRACHFLLIAAAHDRGGNVISQYGDMTVIDVTIIVALAAGSFAATKELARRIGEVEFNALYQQGNGSHIFINFDEDTIMITVFWSPHDRRFGGILFVNQEAECLHFAEEPFARPGTASPSMPPM